MGSSPPRGFLWSRSIRFIPESSLNQRVFPSDRSRTSESGSSCHLTASSPRLGTKKKKKNPARCLESTFQQDVFNPPTGRVFSCLSFMCLLSRAASPCRLHGCWQLKHLLRGYEHVVRQVNIRSLIFRRAHVHVVCLFSPSAHQAPPPLSIPPSPTQSPGLRGGEEK